METTPRKTILLLEDDMLLLRAIKDKLERADYEVLTARTFDQAEEYLLKTEEQPIDLLWLDHYLLGDKTGLDFLKRVRSDEKRKDVPAFVVSNSTNEETVAKYRAVGIAKYYLKANFRLEEIVDDIKRFLN